MSRPIIITENLGKCYNLGYLQAKTPYHQGMLRFQHMNFTLREAIRQRVGSALQRLSKRRQEPNEPNDLFWALRDISFEIQRGEVVGLIGHNGAGKSTLLKIFSRIVEPSEGIARLRGRVASLLEVGTGFHPELSGRENIYLNGAILGMRKTEIDRKFDEIVAFSEIEQFLDTPVKRYSSGMCVRLAFAVAAHLEPEILIVDEVLAVGDQAFQKKCLGKMHDVASGEGRTVLFVSHNMGVLAQLCQQGIHLERGQIATMGPIKSVIETYLRSCLDQNAARAQFPDEPAKAAQFVSADIARDDGSLGSDFSCDEPVTIRLQFEVRRPIPGTFLTFYLQNLEGIHVLSSDFRDTDPSAVDKLDVGRHTFEIQIPPRLLAPTTYVLTVEASNRYTGTIDHRHSCCEFTFRDLATPNQSRSSVLGIQLPWEHQLDGVEAASAPRSR